MHIDELVKRQRKFFKLGFTKRPEYRVLMLIRLKEEIEKMESEILDALKEDLGKSSFEGYMTEVGMTLEELGYMIKNLQRFSRCRPVLTPLAQFPSKSYKVAEPYGVTLIMSPWNYPFLLTMQPLVDALAAGNTAILKPSNYSSATSAVIKKLIGQCFDPEYVSVVEGGREVNSKLLDEHFDYIFFTGGKTVGRLVMEKASAHLTPVSLELGGKSPCIIDESANLKTAARRIVFGKFLNCGQTCVAPDYLLVQESVKDRLTKYILREINLQFGKKPLESQNYGRIINDRHFERLMSLIEGENILTGGEGNADECRISPTVLGDVSMEAPVMQEEIFGPIMPILTFKTIDEAIEMIEKNPSPLALYLFTENSRTKRRLLQQVRFGGGCINDTIIHLATNKMGFGGVGDSGMGSYHGKTGFDTFTHYKSIVDKGTWLDIPVRYQPYNKVKLLLLKKMLK